MPAAAGGCLCSPVGRLSATGYALRASNSALKTVPKFRAMLDKNNGAYYYTMIRRLQKANPPRIKRVGKKIKVIHKNEAPPEGTPEGAP